MGKTTSNNSLNPDRKAAKKGLRSKATIQRLNMYKDGKPIRDKDGKIIGGQLMMNTTSGGKEITGQARIAPDRRWFGNTRVIAQKELEDFREKVSVHNSDPYSVLLRRKKIPMALLHESEKVKEKLINSAGTENFDQAFGKNSHRKKPKLNENISDMEALMSRVSAIHAAKPSRLEENSSAEVTDEAGDLKSQNIQDDLFAKGQSKRIWAELYKVLDCSDVILEVVDARNIPGTRCYHVENHMKKTASHKNLVIIINKCDLVPAWVTRRWVQILSKEFPTVAFHASLTKSFGKGALITLLRQFSKLHSSKRQISVGIVGYPNTGKSSVINTLTGNKSCITAPIPGQTKVWQYVSLTQKIHLIDSPGIVYDGDDHNEVDTVLKGVVRAERLKDPCDYVPAIINLVKPQYLTKQYQVEGWTDATDFLTKIAMKQGRLLRGREPDLPSVAKHVINDFQRGKLPYFFAPPKVEGEVVDETQENEEEMEVAGDEEGDDAEDGEDMEEVGDDEEVMDSEEDGDDNDDGEENNEDDDEEE